MAADQRQTVRADGSICVHGRGTLDLLVTIQGADGQPLDVSARSYFFEVAGLLRVPATAATATQLRIVVERALVEKLSAAPREFALIDETGADPVVVWSNVIRMIGYKGAPA